MPEPNKVPVKSEKASVATLHPLRPFENFRREIDRLFDDFAGGMWRSPFGRPFFDVEPFWRAPAAMTTMPAVDVAETDKAYEITAELPGLDEKNIEVKVADDVLTIRGEKQEEKEENRKDYYLSERSFGSFQRTFQIPSGVDPDKIEASFNKGVLTVTLPKSTEALKSEKKIAVKAA
jgi:HSP20 family protein